MTFLQVFPANDKSLFEKLIFIKPPSVEPKYIVKKRTTVSEEKKILVPTDFSESAYNAMRFAIVYAEKLGSDCTIEVLNVVYPEAEPTDLPLVSESATQLKLESVQEFLKRFKETSIDYAKDRSNVTYIPEIDINVEVGTTPSSVIARVAERDEVHMVIMGTNGEHSGIEKLLGTTASATVRKSKKPVLVIPETYNLEDIVTIGYATDFSMTDPYHIWEVSKMFEPFTVVMRVVHLGNEQKDAKRAIKMEQLKSFFEEQVPSLQITFHEIAGKDIVQSLEDFSENHYVNLMVFQRKNRNFFEEIFHSSTTRKAVIHSKLPSLIIPD